MWSFLSDFPSDIPFQTTREFTLKLRWCRESCGTKNCLLCTHTWTSERTQRYFILNSGPFKLKIIPHIVLVIVYFTSWNIQIYAHMHLWWLLMFHTDPLFMFDTDPLFIIMATLLPSQRMQSASPTQNQNGRESILACRNSHWKQTSGEEQVYHQPLHILKASFSDRFPPGSAMVLRGLDGESCREKMVWHSTNKQYTSSIVARVWGFITLF